MEFRKLNYTTLTVSWDGKQGLKEDYVVGGYWTKGKVSQNRVKERKKRKWDKKECKERLLG